MENEVITQETTLCPEEVAEQNVAVPTEEVEAVVQDAAEQLAELENALQEAKIKLALLVGGASREKLETAYVMANGLCATGKSPETAVEEILTAYPHIRAVQRELPTIGVQSSGCKDGFAAIRSIFSKR